MSQTDRLIESLASLGNVMASLNRQLEITAQSIASLGYVQQKAIHDEPPVLTAANDAQVEDVVEDVVEDDLADLKRDVSAALLAVVRADRGRAQELLAQFGVASGKDLTPEQYPEVLARAEQALAELKELAA